MKHELIFQAGVKGMSERSERSELIPCIYIYIDCEHSTRLKGARSGSPQLGDVKHCGASLSGLLLRE